MNREFFHSTSISQNDELIALCGSNFQDLVLNPKKDVILFVASTSMSQYRENRKQLLVIKSIMKPLKNVDFYEFNPFTQMIPGLSMPESEQPMLSIWPASMEPHGGTISGHFNVADVLDTILKIMKGPHSQREMKEFQENLRQYRKSGPR